MFLLSCIILKLLTIIPLTQISPHLISVLITFMFLDEVICGAVHGCNGQLRVHHLVHLLMGICILCIMKNHLELTPIKSTFGSAFPQVPFHLSAREFSDGLSGEFKSCGPMIGREESSCGVTHYSKTVNQQPRLGISNIYSTLRSYG